MRSGSYFAAARSRCSFAPPQARVAAFYGLPAGLGYGGDQGEGAGRAGVVGERAHHAAEFLAGADFLFGGGLLDSSRIYARSSSSSTTRSSAW